MPFVIRHHLIAHVAVTDECCVHVAVTGECCSHAGRGQGPRVY